MKKILALTLQIFICTIAFSGTAEYKYSKGYYITKKNFDTIPGTINISKSRHDLIYFIDDSDGKEKKLRPGRVTGVYIKDTDQYFMGYKKADVVHFVPRVDTGYYNMYYVTLRTTFYKRQYQSGQGRKVGQSEDTWYVLQHELEDKIDIVGVPWKKRLLKAVADYTELYKAIEQEKTVQWKVETMSPDKVNTHYGHPMHQTPDWVRAYNEWKAR